MQLKIKSGKKWCVLAAFVTLPTGIPAVMVGMYIRIHYSYMAPIDVLPQFILSQLPAWLGGIALATASIGLVAGLVLGVSTMFSRDILAGNGSSVIKQCLPLTAWLYLVLLFAQLGFVWETCSL